MSMLLPRAVIQAPSLLVPKRKPVEPVALDITHRLSQGLVGCFLFPSVKNLVKGSTATGVISGAAIDRNFLELDTNSDYVDLLPTAEIALVTSATTVFLDGSSSGASTGRVTQFGTRVSSINQISSRIGTHIPYTDGKVYWDFGGITEGSSRLSIASLAFSVEDRWCFTAGSRGMEVWQNGILRASNAGTTTRTNNGVLAWTLGCQDSTIASSNPAKNKAVFVYNRQLSTSEIGQFFVNPYQMLIPR